MTESDDPSALAERIARSVRSTLDDDDRSRRSFLNRSALAGGALLAAGGSTGFVMAQDDEGEGEGDTPEEMAAKFDDVGGTDIDVLNYALTLEHIEDVFYRQAIEQFDETAFMESDALADYDEQRRTEVFEYVRTAGEQEATHVEVLTQAVELLGGEPSAELTYEFGAESVGDVLALGQVLENTGVAAYAGAAPFIESPDLLSAALSIHSVEARHAAVLNEVNGESPYPDAFDASAAQADVLEAVGGFIVQETEDPDGGAGNGTATETATATSTGSQGDGAADN